MPDSWRTQRARHAALTRHRPKGHPDIAEAAREYSESGTQERAVEGLETHIRRVVDSAPPLTEAQRSRLAALLGMPTDEQPAP